MPNAVSKGPMDSCHAQTDDGVTVPQVASPGILRASRGFLATAAAWKTFTDRLHRTSFELPQDWTVSRKPMDTWPCSHNCRWRGN